MQRRDIHLHPLPLSREDHAPDPIGEADHFTGNRVLEGHTQGDGIGGRQVDVESPWMLQEGIAQEASNEVDRQ